MFNVSELNKRGWTWYMAQKYLPPPKRLISSSSDWELRQQEFAAAKKFPKTYSAETGKLTSRLTSAQWHARDVYIAEEEPNIKTRLFINLMKRSV